MNWNDSDVGYTFWDEMWNVESDEQRKQRRESASSKDKKEDDLSGPR